MISFGLPLEYFKANITPELQSKKRILSRKENEDINLFKDRTSPYLAFFVSLSFVPLIRICFLFMAIFIFLE